MAIVRQAIEATGIDPRSIDWPEHRPRPALVRPDASGALWVALGEALQRADLNEAQALYDLIARRIALAANGG